MAPANGHISRVVSKDGSLPVEAKRVDESGAGGDKILDSTITFLLERQEQMLGEVMGQCQGLLELARVQLAEIAECLDDD